MLILFFNFIFVINIKLLYTIFFIKYFDPIYNGGTKLKLSILSYKFINLSQNFSSIQSFVYCFVRLLKNDGNNALNALISQIWLAK